LPSSLQDRCSKLSAARSTVSAQARLGHLPPMARIWTTHSTPAASGRSGRSMIFA